MFIHFAFHTQNLKSFHQTDEYMHTGVCLNIFANYSEIIHDPFIDKNLNPQMKAGFQNLRTDAYDLEDMKKSGTTSVEFSPIYLLAGEFYSYE